jgi:hypothetical protein
MAATALESAKQVARPSEIAQQAEITAQELFEEIGQTARLYNPGSVSRSILRAAMAAAIALLPAPAAAEEATLYLNRTGGAFTFAEQYNDSRQNLSSVLSQGPVDIAGWDVDDALWQEVTTCVSDLFAPFGVRVIDTDPGEESHIEAVLGGSPSELGLSPDSAGVAPFSCAAVRNPIVFVFPIVLADDAQTVCETVAQEAAHSLGLDHQYLCEDPMTYLIGCGAKKFQFRESRCGRFEIEDCRCDRPTQNSARIMLDRVGAGPRPALWISQPSGLEPVAQDFVVTAAVTHQPQQLALYVDGSLWDEAPAVRSDQPYELVDLATFQLPTGAHDLAVVGRWSDGTVLQEQVDVEVIKGDGGGNLPGTCKIAGSSPGGGPLLLALLALMARRTRRQRRTRR